MKYKVMFDRLRNYFYYVNLLMVGYLFLDKAGWSWWYLSVIPIIVIVGYIDMTYLLRKEQDTLSRKNPILMEILREVKK